MRLYYQSNHLDFDIPLKGLSNPKREYIPVTDQFVNDEYLNWNGKAGNVGISGRNYPVGEKLVQFILNCISSCPRMLGNSIAE